ncbi:MAG: DNA-processing protein DprA [Planctomycetota bacterium]
MDERDEILLLLNACCLTNRELHRLALLGTAPTMLLRSPLRASELGLRAAVGARLAQLMQEAFAEREVERAAQLDAVIITIGSGQYPSRLREIYDPPLVLYCRGEPVLDGVLVAVVGARKCTPYGRDQARRLGLRLAQHAVPVLSGLALGIDQWAHRGCLDGGGRPIAVLGCGIDQVYPPGADAMHAEVREHGALVSEFPIGMRPSRLGFPRRNRLVSGLAEVVAVIEASQSSGSLITAEFAQQQGRTVFALPGPVDRLESRGTNELIRDGATPLLDADDVLQAIGFTVTEAQAVRPQHELEGVERVVAEQLKLGDACVSELIAETNLGYEAIVAALFGLEARSLVERCAGERYRWRS